VFENTKKKRVGASFGIGKQREARGAARQAVPGCPACAGEERAEAEQAFGTRLAKTWE